MREKENDMSNGEMLVKAIIQILIDDSVDDKTVEKVRNLLKK